MPIKHDPKTGRILPALTPEQKVQAKVMIGQGIKGKVVAAQMGVAPSTISATVVPAWLSPEALDAEKKSFDMRVSALCDKALLALDIAFDNNKPSDARQYALVLAILYDKRALNRGLPTVITSGIESESDEELKKRLADAIGPAALDITPREGMSDVQGQGETKGSDERGQEAL